MRFDKSITGLSSLFFLFNIYIEYLYFMLFKLNSCCIKKELKLTKKYKKQLVL